MKIKLCFLPGLLTLFALLILAHAPARAASLTWDGSANGLWTNAANWTPAFRPTNGDALLFPDGVAQTFVTNSPAGATNYHSITIAGSNYVLRSPFLALTNGLTNGGPVGAQNTVAARVVLRASQTWEVATKTSLILASNVSFTNFTLTVANEGVLQFSNTITGGAGSVLNKTNDGALEIHGTAALTQLTAQEGELEVNGALTGALTLNAGTILRGIGSVPAFTTAGQVQPGGFGASALTVPSGTAVFNGGSSFRPSLGGTGTNFTQLRVASPPTLSGATLSVLLSYSPLLGDTFVIITNTGAGAFATTFAGRPEGSTQTVNNVQFRVSYVGGSGNDVTLTVVGFNASATTRTWDGGGANGFWLNATNWSINAVPGGGQNLVFPVDAARLSNTNDFPASTPFNALTLLTNGFDLGGNALALFGGVHALQDSGSVTLRAPVAHPGTGTARVDQAAASLHLLGVQTLDQGLLVGGAGLTVISNRVRGPGGISVLTPARLNLLGNFANDFEGGVQVFDGAELGLGSASSLGLSGAFNQTVVFIGALLSVDAEMTNAEPVDMFGRWRFTQSATWTGPVELDGPGVEFEIATSRTGRLAGALSGAGIVATKSSSGTLVLEASNSVSGTLLQGDGNVLVNGTSRGLNVTVNFGVLGGTGEVANLTADGNGLVRPGQNRSGALTCSNFTVLSGTATFYADVNSATQTRLRVQNAVQLDGDLIVATIFPPAMNVPFVIIDNGGLAPVSGTFAGLPEGSSLVFSGLTYRVSYAGGDGNDVTLELISVAPTGFTRIWDGGGANNFWSNRTNWSGDSLPEAGDAILFPANLAPADAQTTNDFPPTVVFDQLVFRNGSGGTATFLRGNGLSLLNGVVATNTVDSPVVSLALDLEAAQTFAVASASLTFDGSIFLSDDVTVSSGGGSIAFNGGVFGPGGIIKTGGGSLTLGAANTFGGAVALVGGGLNVTHQFALGSPGGGTTVGVGTILQLSHSGALAENLLTVLGQVSVSGTNSVAGEVALPATGTPFGASAGSQLTFSGPLTGAGSPLFQGGGHFVIAGTNHCLAETTVQNSTVRVNGRSTAGDLNLNVGGTLGGTGVVGRLVAQNSGVINPGTSPGALTSGDLSMFSGTRLLAELNSTDPGTGYDQLVVNGTVFISGGALQLATGFTALYGDTFTLIVNDGGDAITGTFSGLPEAATLTTNGMTFRISYVGGDGNDVTITRVLAATGVTRTWDGGGLNNAWSNRTNWVGDLAPIEGDDLFFPSVAARKNNTNDFPAFFGFNSLTVADGYILGAAGVTLNGGLFATNGGGPTINLPVLLNSSQSNFLAAGTTLTFNNGINLGAHTLLWGVDGQLNLSGQLAGGGALFKTGAGAVILSGTNTLAGPMDFRGGSVSVNSSNVFGGALGATVLGAGVVMQFNFPVATAESFMLDGVTGNPATMQFVSGTSTLSGPIFLSASQGSARFNPQAGEVRLNGQLTGGSLSKDGAGRLVLNGGNLHTNTTSLTAGALIINGSQLASAVEVNGASSVLGGTGVTARAVLSGGTLSPGTSPGKITFVGGLTNSASVTNFFEINGPAPGGGYDQIAVIGNVGLNGSVLRLSFGYSPAFGEAFTLIDNQGLNPIGGTFAGLPEGSLLTNGAVVARLTYLGGTGNDVVLTRIAVPTFIARTWDGGGADNLWSNPLNWTGDILPQPGDDVVLPGTVAKAPHFNAGTNIAYNTLLLGRAYTITVAAGHSMRLINGLTATNATGVVALHPAVTLENNQLWAVAHPGAFFSARGLVDLSLATLTHAGAGSLEMTARVTGSGGLSGNSSGSLLLSGTNDFTGTVTINSGALDVQSPGALGSTGAGTFIGTAGRLSMGLPNDGAIDEPIILAGRVDVVLGVTNIWNGPVTLTGTQTAFDTFNTGTLRVNGPLLGGGWQTLGLGSLVLNSPAGFTGPLRVGGSTRVFVNEDHSAMFFALTNSGILGGTGTVGQISATTCAGCAVAPGSRNLPGVLRSSSVTLASGASLRAEINGLVAGTDYDQLDVTGSVTLTGSSLVVTNGFNPGTGATFTLINNDGADAVVGTFNGLPSGALVMSGAVTYEISYTGGDGNDVVLTRVVGAPPSTIQPPGLSNSVPVITGLGLPGVPYVLEATPHLNTPIPWQPILTNTTDGAGVYHFLDFDGTNFPMRFYRVLSP